MLQQKFTTFFSEILQFGSSRPLPKKLIRIKYQNRYRYEKSQVLGTQRENHAMKKKFFPDDFWVKGFFFFFFFILRRMGKNKALAHHTSTCFHTRRVSI